MEITEVRVFIADEEDERLKAYATVTFDNCFVVRDLKVILGNSGLFVAMPSKKRKDGTYKDIAHPINKDFRTKVEDQVLETYNEERKAHDAGERSSSYEKDYESSDASSNHYGSNTSQSYAASAKSED